MNNEGDKMNEAQKFWIEKRDAHIKKAERCKRNEDPQGQGFHLAEARRAESQIKGEA